MEVMIQAVLFILSFSCCLSEKHEKSSYLYNFGVKHTDSSETIKHIQPSKEIVEVCEGDIFMLSCPENSSIKLAKNSDIQFGRNGAWENKTKCGSGDVEHCTNINGKKLFLSSCSGKTSCVIHLDGSRGYYDPCRRDHDSQDPRKYLTLRYSCKNSENVQNKAMKLKLAESLNATLILQPAELKTTNNNGSDVPENDDKTTKKSNIYFPDHSKEYDEINEFWKKAAVYRYLL